MSTVQFVVGFFRHVGWLPAFNLAIALTAATIVVPPALTHPTHAYDLSVMLLGGIIIGLALMGVMYAITIANFNALQRKYDELKTTRNHRT